MQKLMILSKMCITKGIDLRTEDTRTTTATTEGDLTEVEEEAEATEEEFRKDTRTQLILMVTFPDVEFVNLSIIGKTTAQELRLRTQEFMQQFTGEMLGAAVLDSGATSTVCRKTWINCYEETLSDEDRLKVRKEPNSTNFKFGDG